MTDFPYVAPPEDGLRRAMADARGRRYRKAGLSTSTVAAVLAVAAAIAGGQGTQSLIQQPAPEQPAVTRLVPDGEGPEGTSETRPNQVGSVAGFAGTSAASRTTTRGADAGTSAAAPGGSSSDPAKAAGTAARKPYSPGAIKRSESTVYLPSDPGCNVTGRTEDATALCPYASAGPGNAAGTYQFYGEVGSTRTSTTSLHFAGRNEVDFAVYKGAQEVWRWSSWHPDGGVPHTLIIAAGDYCTWSFEWTGVDFTGKRLPAGTYTMRVEFLADELAKRSTLDYDFAVS